METDVFFEKYQMFVSNDSDRWRSNRRNCIKTERFSIDGLCCEREATETGWLMFLLSSCVQKKNSIRAPVTDRVVAVDPG